MSNGFHGNLGDLAVSIVDCRTGARLTNSRLIHGSRLEPVGTNRGRNDGIAKRRKRSAARRTARSRSVSYYR